MPNEFQFAVPALDGTSVNFTLKAGDALYVLGANGTGKSSLVTRLFGRFQADAKRISAHRQTWFESNALDLTPRNRQDLESNFRSQDAQARSRYYEWNASGRSHMAIFDLIDADTMQERKIASLVRAGSVAAAEKAAQSPSPIQDINELMRLSNLLIEISVEEGQKIVARKNGGATYSVAELSDGERNAFLIAANVLTAKPGTLILVDEPERHLHRSIISPLLKLLFDKRKDCAFVVSTHELMLPIDVPEASTMLVRGCEYEGQNVRAWAVDVIPPGAVIDERLKIDLLGARRKMLFVEGTAQSLDVPLYSLLFPQVSVIPKESCRDVEYAVRGLRGAHDVHWTTVWGIVDNDQRSAADLDRLRQAGVWALRHYSVESLYFHQNVIKRIASRQSQLTGEDGRNLVSAAISDAIEAAKLNKAHLVTGAVLRSVRSRIMDNLPARQAIEGGVLKFEVDVPDLRAQEVALFDRLVAESDWDGLLVRYPLRESSAFDRVISGLKIANGPTYRSAVLKLLQDDLSALQEMRGLLGGLYGEVMG